MRASQAAVPTSNRPSPMRGACAKLWHRPLSPCRPCQETILDSTCVHSSRMASLIPVPVGQC
eukprot:1900525-Lingulodinium_polyedra.AAC.1